MNRTLDSRPDTYIAPVVQPIRQDLGLDDCSDYLAISIVHLRILIVLLSLLLDIEVDQNIKKLEASSLKGITYKGTQC